MNYEEVTVICVIAIAIAVTSIKGCEQVEITNRQRVAAGLVEQQNTGSTGTHWVKP